MVSLNKQKLNVILLGVLWGLFCFTHLRPPDDGVISRGNSHHIYQRNVILSIQTIQFIFSSFFAICELGIFLNFFRMGVCNHFCFCHTGVRNHSQFCRKGVVLIFSNGCRGIHALPDIYNIR